MATKIQELEVKVCDTCDRHETVRVTITTCWKCGGDFCSSDGGHLIKVVGIATPGAHTYLCSNDRTTLDKALRVLLSEFQVKRPEGW